MIKARYPSQRQKPQPQLKFCRLLAFLVVVTYVLLFSYIWIAHGEPFLNNKGCFFCDFKNQLSVSTGNSTSHVALLMDLTTNLPKLVHNVTGK